MNKRNLLITGGVAALSLALITLAAPPANSQTNSQRPCPDESVTARLAERLAQLQTRLTGRQEEVGKLAELHANLASELALAQNVQAIQQLQSLPALADDDDHGVSVLLDEGDSSWLGVELHEVTSETAKELKLPAERGVVLSSIVPDSPAAKAGLKENDVVTEINGQRVEGAAQFRRMIREIPAERTAQITVWRDGRAQTITVTLGKAQDRRHSLKMVTPAPGAPGSFSFSMPDIAIVPPTMELDGGRLMIGGQPRLGIDAEDLNGQLGSFFGAPDGEGILVREVNPGSAAEKGGLKAGDVITSVNGDRVRTVGDLREKLAAKRDAKDKDKDQTVKLGVLRNKSEVSLTVELPAPAARTKRFISHRTNI